MLTKCLVCLAAVSHSRHGSTGVVRNNQNRPSPAKREPDAGFHTWWISNQFPVGHTDSPVALYAYTAQHVVWLNHASLGDPGSYDGVLVGALRKALASDSGNLFIVLHMMGSHAAYTDRYPPAFRKWQAGPGAGGGVAVRDDYDNSVRYSDHVLAALIQVLRDSGSEAALWFESDHGEHLWTKTCPQSGHGTLPEYEIPAFAWLSPDFVQAQPVRAAMLRAHAGARTSSADTFETLAGLAGVDFRGNDITHDLTSRAWSEHPRFVGWSVPRVRFDEAVEQPSCGVLVAPGAASAAVAGAGRG